MDEARAELEKGLAEWKWASTAESNDEADIVLAACGDVPTRGNWPLPTSWRPWASSSRFVNVVDLLKIQYATENDQALSDEEFAELFTATSRSCSLTTPMRATCVV